MKIIEEIANQIEQIELGQNSLPRTKLNQIKLNELIELGQTELIEN